MWFRSALDFAIIGDVGRIEWVVGTQHAAAPVSDAVSLRVGHLGGGRSIAWSVCRVKRSGV